jgi:hypothetical protein
VIAAIGQHFVKTGELPPEHHAALHAGFDKHGKKANAPDPAFLEQGIETLRRVEWDE